MLASGSGSKRMKYIIIFLLALMLHPALSGQAPVKLMVKESTRLWGVDITMKSCPVDSADSFGFMESDRIYKIVSTDEERWLGYGVSASAPGRFENFEYFVLFDTDLVIRKVRVWKYRSSYGGAVAGRRWLKQFSGHGGSRLRYGHEIQAIAGATISGHSLVEDINRLDSLVRNDVLESENR